MSQINNSEFSFRKKHFSTGKASKFIHHVRSLPRGTKVVLVCRVSFRRQRYSGNLKDQEMYLRRIAEEYGLIVVAVFSIVISGMNPCWIDTAAKIAMEHGAVLLAETTDRFIRHQAYHSKHRPDLQAEETDLQMLSEYAQGVTLCTVLHPDSTAEQVRSFQKRRGQQEKDRKGGNECGSRKTFKEKWIKTALELNRKGKSLREISKYINDRSRRKISHESIRKWIKNSPY